MRLRTLTTIVVAQLSICLANAQAQIPSTYQSDVDSALTVRSVSLLPIFDNLQGIYARPIEKALINKLKNSHHFNYLESNYAGPITTPDDLEEDAPSVQKIFSNFAADSFVIVGISKGPSGIAIRMDLFLKTDQKMVAQEVQSGIQKFDIPSVQHIAEDMLEKLMHKLPYSGLILSREGTRVTVNLGRLDGVSVNQLLPVVEIIKATRHPKFNFLVSTQKQIIGQIKLLKVDDTLSFGRIVTEVEPGCIQVNSKIAPLDGIVYSNINSLSNIPTGTDALLQQPLGKVTYGKNPEAWVPERQPTFGMVGARFGIGHFVENVTQSSTSLDDNASVYPSVFVEGELWLTPAWSAHANIRQGIISTHNPVSGGSPSQLSHQLSIYDFMFGYNIRLAPSIYAPKIELLFGYMSYDMFVDKSNPAGITSKTYSGPKIGLSGWYPITPNSVYAIGADFYYMFSPHLSESPTSSGSSTNSVTQYGIYLDKQLKPNLKARFELDFDLLTSNFSGGDTSSQQHDTLSGGLYYLF